MKESLAEQLSHLTGKSIPEKEVKKKKKKKTFPQVKEENLARGSVIYIPLSAEEGLIVTGGYKERNKYVTIIGTTADGFVIGSLLINTDPHDATPELGACQFPLKLKDYPSILDYDSWLDCSQLFRIAKKKVLSRGGYCGSIISSDWDLILPFLRETEAISNREKREFGIIV